MPCMDDVTEEGFTEMLGQPEIGYVQRSDGQDLEPGIPEYIVKPTSYRTHSWNPAQSIKIIDFGESFLSSAVPQTLHTPLSVRAPEVIFQDHIDYRVDLWSMGCMLFELFTGQPPFDTFFITPAILVGQMREMASDDIPERWQGIWDTMNTGDGRATENTGPNLQE
ncbi:protein kinase [Histoplasma ohiense]|nr:protein kinase [Histoplasma ohiense (nom. inval.)]